MRVLILSCNTGEGHNSAGRAVKEALERFLAANSFDVIVTPHLFPAETLTAMRKWGTLTQKCVAVATDYTCIPFWEETACDYYVIPHEDLKEEFRKKGIPEEKLLPLGIPVRQSFLSGRERKEAKRRCQIPPEEKTFLVMSGSMGFGKIQLFVMELARHLKDNEGIVVICGNNRRLQRILCRELAGRKNVRILGYTPYVSDYMDACDVIFTKPGGLTSTEAAVKNIPIIHTRPIPGCEEKNLKFFQGRGMSVGPRRMLAQLQAGRTLMEQDDLRRKMEEAQRVHISPDSARKICELLEGLTGEKESE